MALTSKQEPSIQMTLFDYFMDQEQFTLNDAVEAVKQVKEVKEPSVRARIYEGIDKGYFQRLGKGIYTVKKQDEKGIEHTCMLINGNGRDLSFIEDNSIDCIITDHPYELLKSLKGGNRNFAEYDCFTYNEKDFQEKQRVLKPGCFLVEFLPEENGDNYQYIYHIKEMAAKAGMEYYATVPWKKGDFVANTGRKAKNTEQVVFFTKGISRSLRLDAKKNKEMIEDMDILHFEKEWEDLTNDVQVIEFELLVANKDCEMIESELNNAYENWMYADCEHSILNEDYPDFPLEQIPIGDYMLLWLDKQELNYIDITGKFGDVDYGLLSETAFTEKTVEILKEVAPERLHYMSGAMGMLPTEFDVEPVNKKDKIHPAEKPVELLEQIIKFVTKEDELILDPFAGSGVLGEAALKQRRNSILIEKDFDVYEKEKERLQNIKNGDSVEYLKQLAEEIYSKEQHPEQSREEYINEMVEKGRKKGINLLIAELKDIHKHKSGNSFSKVNEMQIKEP